MIKYFYNRFKETFEGTVYLNYSSCVCINDYCFLKLLYRTDLGN